MEVLKIWNLLLQFSLGFFVALSGALFPGPLLAFVTMKTLDSGPKAGTLAAIGHIMVELGLLISLALPLGAVLQSETFKVSIGAAGGILLIPVGVLIIYRSRNSDKSSQEMAVKERHPITGGVLFSTVLNPSVVLWWMTVGLGTLLKSIASAGIIGGGLWMLGHFTADLIWFSSVSLLTYKGREIIGTRFYKGLLIVCGLTLLVFGVYFTAKYLPEIVL